MPKIIFHTINTAVTTSAGPKSQRARAQLNKDRRTRGTVGYKAIGIEFIEKNKDKYDDNFLRFIVNRVNPVSASRGAQEKEISLKDKDKVIEILEKVLDDCLDLMYEASDIINDM